VLDAASVDENVGVEMVTCRTAVPVVVATGAAIAVVLITELEVLLSIVTEDDKLCDISFRPDHGHPVASWTYVEEVERAEEEL
jgi:hypothetical protein